MSELSKPEYLAKVKLLTKEEAERLLSRMEGKLPRRLQKDKISKEEALAIQMELEDEQLQHWRNMIRILREKEKAKEEAKANKEAKAKKEAKTKEETKIRKEAKGKAAEKTKTPSKAKIAEKAKTPSKARVGAKAKIAPVK
ncbi:MAG: hypothetical protein ACLQHK_10265 [Gallionellaceae bacterium]